MINAITQTEAAAPPRSAFSPPVLLRRAPSGARRAATARQRRSRGSAGVDKHDNDQERWLLTYADMITLLVALFAMLYSMSRVEQQKMERFKSGARASLGATKVSARTPPAGRRIFEGVAAVVRARNLQNEVSVLADPDGAVIRLRDGGMLFDPGTADLKERTKTILGELAAAIRTDAARGTIRKIRVEGHTDDTPIRSARFPSNWELSTARATSVLRQIAARHPDLGPRLEAAGCADTLPVAANTSAGGRAANRRVEIRVLLRANK